MVFPDDVPPKCSLVMDERPCPCLVAVKHYAAKFGHSCARTSCASVMVARISDIIVARKSVRFRIMAVSF